MAEGEIVVEKSGEIDAGVSSPEPPAALAGKPRQLFAVKGLFAGDFSAARGAFLFVIDAGREKLDHLFAIIIGDTDELKFHIQQPWKTMESLLVEARLSGHVVHQMSLDVQAYLRRVIQDELRAEICQGLVTKNHAELRRLLSEVLSRAIADSNVLLEMAVEPLPETEIPEADVPAESSVSAAQSAPVQASQVKLRVDPLLSPVQGVAIKNLKPGMMILVQPRDISGQKQNLIRLLATQKQGVPQGTCEGRVVSVGVTQYDRVDLVVELAPNITGHANISGELKVRVTGQSSGPTWTLSGAAAGHTPGPLPPKLIFGLAAAVLALMLILAYFVFAGGIL